jgi:AraC-like DNA-binding protein
MHASSIDMDISRTIDPKVHLETRFRAPSPVEQALQFWVDRIGSATGNSNIPPFRILGQFAVISVEEGSGRLETAGRSAQNVTAGDVIFVSPQIPTRYYATPSWYTRWIVWNGEFAARLRDLDITASGSLLHNAARPVRAAFFRLASLMQEDSPLAALERQAVVLQMLAELCRISTPSGKSEGPSARVRACVEEIGQFYARNHSVAALAKSAGLSVSQFRRLFTRQTGSSPAEFLRITRISRAKELLLRGVSIKETAEQTGFSDVFYFMRAFKQIAGVPPGKFVQLHGWAKEAPQ